ncbi:alpha/beta fold hydrolase [Mycobacterium vicinigordonae]|nr:alpha/beta hydrolase [Mycobacterium vicinigordonae]
MINVEDQVRLHIQDLGTGPAVVFVSGFGLDHELWDRQVRVFAAAGYRTICVTQRGHGSSDHPLHGYEIDRLRDDLVAVLETLRVRDVVLVGHSFGGQVAFHTAVVAPYLVSKLVLVGSNAVRASRSDEFPFGGPPETLVAHMVQDEIQDRIAARHRLIRSCFASEQHPGVIEWLLRTWLRMPSWSAVACYQTMLRSDLVHELPEVRQPVLQITGKADPVHSGGGARWLQQHLVDATLTELGCGHFPMLEAAEEFDRILAGFL